MKQILRFLFMVFTAMLFAQSTATMSVGVLINPDHGWPKDIIVDGSTSQEKSWLGISFYPYNVVDPITGGRHSNMELKKGTFHHEMSIDQPLLGGSFEFAIWGEKVYKVDCTIDYCYWCKTNGHHFDNLLVYKSGLLKQMKGYE